MSAKVDSLARRREDRERALSTKILDLENQLRDKEELLGTRDDQVEVLRSQMDALTEQMTDMRKRNERLSSEIERLIFELKQKQIRLAKIERADWRSLARRNLWRRAFAGLCSFMQKPEHSKR